MPDELRPSEEHRIALAELLADVLSIAKIVRFYAPESEAATVTLPRLEKRLIELRALQ